MYLTRKNIIIAVVVILLIVTFIIYQSVKVEEPPKFDVTVQSAVGDTELGVKLKDVELPTVKKEEPQIIKVDIKGAVHNPGVYEMKTGDRVEDAIIKAGGVTENADLNLTNQALEVYDTMQIIVYEIGEKVTNPESGQTNGIINSKIDINHATESELMSLSGIGKSKATAIITYRNENGDFKKIEDIKNVTGIGDGIFKRIKNNIIVH